MDKGGQVFSLINYDYSNMTLRLFYCTIGILLGFCLHIIVNRKITAKEQSIKGQSTKGGIRKSLKRNVRKLDNIVLLFSFIGAVFCLYVDMFLGKEDISIQLLSFYTSFIFAWLLTKKSAKEEFKATQHKVAKNTYRHIEDVETAALKTMDRLYDIKDNKQYSMEELDGILDNVEIILTGIRSNKKDWMEMLKPSYVKKLEAAEDPEARLLHSKEKRLKRSNMNGNQVIHPELDEITSALGDKNHSGDKNA